jgi:hypothetical protein
MILIEDLILYQLYIGFYPIPIRVLGYQAPPRTIPIENGGDITLAGAIIIHILVVNINIFILS